MKFMACMDQHLSSRRKFPISKIDLLRSNATQCMTGFLRFLIDKFVGMPTDSRVLLNVMSDAGMLNSEDLRRKEAVENLKGNIRELAAQCKQQGVLLIVCTVAAVMNVVLLQDLVNQKLAKKNLVFGEMTSI